MADRRPDGGGSRAKRLKTEATDLDPRDNPYLAHMYADEQQTNGSQSWTDGSQSILAGFKRHSTTAAMAKKAEDSKINPFNGKPMSERYFSILKTRRDLPVHAQRYVLYFWLSPLSIPLQ